MEERDDQTLESEEWELPQKALSALPNFTFLISWKKKEHTPDVETPCLFLPAPELGSLLVFAGSAAQHMQWDGLSQPRASSLPCHIPGTRCWKVLFPFPRETPENPRPNSL